MGTEVVQFDIQKATALADRIVATTKGQPQIEAETAMLMAYVSIARGVSHYPLASRQERGLLVVQRAAATLCRIIEDVAGLTEADAFAQFAAGAKAVPHG